MPYNFTRIWIILYIYEYFASSAHVKTMITNVAFQSDYLIIN